MAGAGGTGFEGGSGRGSGSLDFDLNIAPIIDAFVVLISFLLASAAMISIGLLDAGIAAGGVEQASPTPPPVNLTIELKGAGVIAIKVSGKETSTTTVPAKDGTWDYDAMTQRLLAFKSKWPQVNAATLTGENTTEYKDIVKSMEVVRKTLPAVLLGGF